LLFPASNIAELKRNSIALTEIDKLTVEPSFYALLPDGYIGCSVTIELTYAYAKGKRIVASEAPAEFAVRPMISTICSPEEFPACLKERT
jgi:hypothetical protein